MFAVPFLLNIVSGLSYGKELVHGIEEGENHIHGVHKECALPDSKEDIVDCALGFHPSIQRGILKVGSTSKLEEQVSQIPNPIFSSRYVRGDNDEEVFSELETNLAFTLELGGKRESRKEHAKAKKDEVIASNQAIKAQIKIATVLSLHRMRQVLEEKKLLSEIISAFGRVTGELKVLRRLSAEQEASLALFEMAKEETKIHQAELLEEERKLEHFFHVSTGHSMKEIQKYLPLAPRKWPTIPKVKGEKKSPEIKKLSSLVNLAKKELEIQKAQAWPDLKIGPSFAIEKFAEVENKMVGFNLQVALPLFQTNDGGRAYAREEYLRAQKNVSLTLAEENHERFEQLRIYESSVEILTKTTKRKVIDKKHNKIAKLYLRGVVSSSVFFDSLKQKLSYLKSRNDREMSALMALWNIHKYDGRIFEEKI